MSRPSPLEIVGGPRNGGEGIRWALLRYGWPALILALGIVAGTLLEPPGPDGLVDLSVYGLSAEALAQGRWWTLVSHAFLPVPVFPSILLGAAFLIVGLTATSTANPGWMGGWRMPAIFLASAGVGALVQLSMSPATMLSGPWAGVAGLVAYQIISGRLAGLFASAREPQLASVSKASQPRSAWEGDASSLYLLIGPICLALQVDFAPAELFSMSGRLVFGGGIVALGVLAFVGLNIGGSPRLVRLGAWLGNLMLLAVIVVGLAKTLRDVDFTSLHATVIALPWAGYLAGAAAGLIAGLIERRTVSAR